MMPPGIQTPRPLGGRGGAGWDSGGAQHAAPASCFFGSNTWNYGSRARAPLEMAGNIGSFCSPSANPFVVA